MLCWLLLLLLLLLLVVRSMITHQRAHRGGRVRRVPEHLR
jgi:hypothetical protein